MKRQRGLRAIALALIVALTMSVNVWAVDETNADRLNALELFLGTGNGYALEGTATRLHGIIMLTRLLGEEEEALEFTGPYPFTDVAEGNPSRYTGYAYARGYTAGVTADTFNPNGALSFKHYVTFLLRALNYDDSEGDFTFATSLDKAAEIGMMNEASAKYINENSPTLYRADLVDLSVSALTTEVQNSGGTLAEMLVERGVFTLEEGRAQGFIGGERETYVHPELRSSAGAEPVPEQPVVQQPAASANAVTRVTKTYTVASGSVTADVITVNLKDPGVSLRASLVGNRLGSTANFSDIVAASGADIVINANFFGAYEGQDRFPTGHLMAGGSFLQGISGLPSFCFTDDGEIYSGAPALFFYVRGGGVQWACYELNSKQQGPTLSVIYTPAFGSSVSITSPGVATTITNGVITATKSVAVGETVAIPSNGMVMVYGAAFAAEEWVHTPVVGTAVTLEPALTKNDTSGIPMDQITNIVSGGPKLVENGAIYTELGSSNQDERFTTMVTPRTAIGKLSDGKLVIVSTNAASIQNLRELMVQLGCVEAINLDGGGSTALAYQGQIIRAPGRQLTATLHIDVN